MALEDLTGTNKYIANLVNTNPLSADDRREGDDHIRGIKNVLLNTFPGVGGPISFGNYVLKAGDTMTGPLTATGFALSSGLAYWEETAGSVDTHAAPTWLWSYNKTSGDLAWLRGNAVASSFLRANGDFVAGNNVYTGAHEGAAMAMIAGPSSSVLRFSGTGWRLEWFTSNSGLYFMSAANAQLIAFDSGGQAYKAGTGTAWLNISDARTKNVTGDYAAGLSEILGLQPRTFHYIEGIKRDASIEHAGLIAQEVELVMPDLVSIAKDGAGGIGDIPDLRVLDVSNITYALINAVKTLHARVEALEELCAGIGDA